MTRSEIIRQRREMQRRIREVVAQRRVEVARPPRRTDGADDPEPGPATT
ncbi:MULTISPECIES: hypothetical protein [Polymorphospora]|uniref:Uncharacterized protein n=1 Tax=Polymorphospora lycopeni TaxID=3140240 RepID=A0ABV5CJ20_9ACTN